MLRPRVGSLGSAVPPRPRPRDAATKIKCTDCGRFVQNEAAQCKNGHLAHKSCVIYRLPPPDQLQCRSPECKRLLEILEGDGLLLQLVRELIPVCGWCKSPFPPTADYGLRHLEQCQKRLIACPFAGVCVRGKHCCDAFVPADDILRHCIGAHGVPVQRELLNSRFTLHAPIPHSSLSSAVTHLISVGASAAQGLPAGPAGLSSGASAGELASSAALPPRSPLEVGDAMPMSGSPRPRRARGPPAPLSTPAGAAEGIDARLLLSVHLRVDGDQIKVLFRQLGPSPLVKDGQVVYATLRLHLTDDKAWTTFRGPAQSVTCERADDAFDAHRCASAPLTEIELGDPELTSAGEFLPSVAADPLQGPQQHLLLQQPLARPPPRAAALLEQQQGRSAPPHIPIAVMRVAGERAASSSADATRPAWTEEVPAGPAPALVSLAHDRNAIAVLTASISALRPAPQLTRPPRRRRRTAHTEPPDPVYFNGSVFISQGSSESSAKRRRNRAGAPLDDPRNAKRRRLASASGAVGEDLTGATFAPADPSRLLVSRSVQYDDAVLETASSHPPEEAMAGTAEPLQVSHQVEALEHPSPMAVDPSATALHSGDEGAAAAPVAQMQRRRNLDPKLATIGEYPVAIQQNQQTVRLDVFLSVGPPEEQDAPRRASSPSEPATPPPLTESGDDAQILAAAGMTPLRVGSVVVSKTTLVSAAGEAQPLARPAWDAWRVPLRRKRTREEEDDERFRQIAAAAAPPTTPAAAPLAEPAASASLPQAST